MPPDFAAQYFLESFLITLISASNTTVNQQNFACSPRLSSGISRAETDRTSLKLLRARKYFRSVVSPQRLRRQQHPASRAGPRKEWPCLGIGLCHGSSSLPEVRSYCWVSRSQKSLNLQKRNDCALFAAQFHVSPIPGQFITSAPRLHIRRDTRPVAQEYSVAPGIALSSSC